MDLRLRKLERQGPESWRYRFEQYRISGIFEWRVGDLIEVMELPDLPWATEPFLATVEKIKPSKDAWVEPVDRATVKFRIPEFANFKSKFYITADELLNSRPVMP